MATPSSRKNVLVLGIVKYVDEKGGFPISAAQIQAVLDTEISKAASSPYNLEIFEINPNIPSNMADLRVKLRSKNWDGIAIGGGVRFAEDLTATFENAVNMAIEEVRPLKMIFNSKPNNILEGVARVLGQF
ncbi:uncharacterized protein PAC_16529 [Phialocephala subalpina]|uniref:Uncharacterized protein n=1 Tax=Phialocephala subalpina TaxID=576137 RepID=A0A1L7XNM3_9HELO|nr:uncharacterized protein PAC_16529 [Phialocephala subalpina]